MDKKSAIKKIWGERFNDSRQWMEMVFSRVYNDDDAMTISDGDITVSSLLLRRLSYRHLGQEIPASYIYGAATMRRWQGEGFMSQLMTNAINQSYRRGDIVSFLHPAKSWLFDFYARFGFSPAVLVDEQRYTALHRFPSDPDRFTVETTVYEIDRLSAGYNRLSLVRPSSLLHSPTDFKTILIDNSIDSGVKAVVTHRDTGEIAAIAFAIVDSDDALHVTDLTADSDASATEALGAIKQQLDGYPMVVDTYPQRDSVDLIKRGMARIINVEGMLRVVAAADPKTKITIETEDPIIAENNATFRLSAGEVCRLDGAHADNSAGQLHVDVTTLTSILFSDPHIGEIMSLPTARPYLSLLLG